MPQRHGALLSGALSRYHFADQIVQQKGRPRA